jgi:flagellar biosynthetic protein FliQ
MNADEAVQVVNESLILLLELSMPLLLIGGAVGLVIAIFQSLTQIQEASLTFVPKIIVVFVGLMFLAPSMVQKLQDFMLLLADRIINVQ